MRPSTYPFRPAFHTIRLHLRSLIRPALLSVSTANSNLLELGSPAQTTTQSRLTYFGLKDTQEYMYLT